MWRVPYGVTLHFVTEGIDDGDIIVQQIIEKSWEDTGKTLYDKSMYELEILFIKNFEKIINLQIERKKKNLDQASFHFRRELNQKINIDLNQYTRIKEILNLLRAPFGQKCYFLDNGEKYNISIEIKKD